MSAPGQPTDIEADVLIIGSGLAGLMLALKVSAAGASCILATKGALADSNSSFAQGGVAAVTGANPFDAPDLHLSDTIKAGAGLCDQEVAEAIVYGGQRLISELDELGVGFDKNPAGVVDLALEGGHKQARVLHSRDSTGRSITEALGKRVQALAATNPRLQVLENCFAVDLLKAGENCCGAKLIRDGQLFNVFACHTVLATGGLGQVFERTTNPAVATGDGIALAYRAGARLADMEFVQFHPTALRKDGAPAFLVSEAARGAGAVLLDHKGRRFVGRFHQDGELATRDVVSRAIHAVMTEHDLQEVYLDLRPIGEEKIAERFPNIVKTLSQYGIDVLRQPVPVAPAAHYMMGGIEATVSGRTTVPGLYAIGECACTGLHGANRLASNSLLEAGVMALSLADVLAAGRSRGEVRREARRSADRAARQMSVLPASIEDFRRQMYRHAGLVRSQAGLTGLLNTAVCLAEGKLTLDQYRSRNIFQVGMLIARAALARQESRGAHLREDFGSIDEQNFARHLWLSVEGQGWEKSMAMLYH